MPPRSWATPDQTAFLLEWVEAFQAAQVNGNLKSSFWPDVNHAWGKKFPEAVELFGPHPPDSSELTSEQKELLGKAKAKRKKVCISIYLLQILTYIQRLHSWFYNHTGQQGRKAHRAVTHLMRNMLDKAKNHRKIRPVELYSKKYYTDKVKATVDEELLTQGSSDDVGRNRLQLIKKTTSEAFQNEDPEVRAEIMREIQEIKEKETTNENGGTDRTPTEMQR